MMPSVQTLQRFSVFAHLDHMPLQTMALLMREIEVSKGQPLFQEGEQATVLYMVVDGNVELEFKLGRRDNQPTSLEILGTGDMIGWSAWYRPMSILCSAVASTDATLLEVDSVKLRSLMEENSEIGYRLMSYAAQVIRRRLTNMYVRFVSLVEA
jgi:CRP-like cAMP-binding protein